MPLSCRFHGRFHGLFSPDSKLRDQVVPQKTVEEKENPRPGSLFLD
jgi:hypothetical protein